MNKLKEQYNICDYYRTGRKCIYDKSCGEKLETKEGNICCSYLYYAIQLEKENLRLKIQTNNLKTELSSYGATGICETCTEQSLRENDKLRVENEVLSRVIKGCLSETDDCSYCEIEKAYNFLKLKLEEETEQVQETNNLIEELKNENVRLLTVLDRLQDIAIDGYCTGTQTANEKALKEIQLKIEKELQNEL